ncbi:HAD-IB family phosphatase [Acidiferrimicrobium sp. IK]|uniref:HAD-IB family phosphatase n=1 Tax=Acidiferrimicrobium sp. IK TaxID=2871700 RepID=UPI0021CAE701|nr:HAD-IB family phosphatase [Acidiferrimicrobium sp. IK]MCU4184571.1 HAD-IB family phosphatase [Acidiferrimicrobium sp. IK]
MLREALGGRRIGITGATGFLGTALAERFLRAVPDCEIALLVRPGRRGPADRVRREILRNNCFDRLREELGADFDATMDRRIKVMAGDVGEDGLGLDDAGRELLAGCSTVIHSAATVSFDSPLDRAVEINLLGPSRVAAALNQLHDRQQHDRQQHDRQQHDRQQHDGQPAGAKPHLIAVSTAYVAGSRRGQVPEAVLPETPWATELAWRPEVAAARRARSDADAASREPKMLDTFRAKARAELGAAGTPLLAARSEKFREEWVDERMVTIGKARAQGLGWPDAYAYTKSLGERALLDTRGDLPLTIVRPSIIEAAMEEPHPGWIRGFRMADPVIIGYARGLLREFPGIPEGVIDVIPVDMVVATIMAVAARGPQEDNVPDVFHSASGARNPLRYRQLVDLVQEWFTEHPLADSRDQPISVPEWSFPGRHRVQRQLGRAANALGTAEKVLQALPLRGKQADLAARLEERRDEAERALSYVELYGAYTETEAIFGLDRLLALWDGLPAEDQADFGFDPAAIDWPHFCHDVYLPSVVAHARVRLAPSGAGTKKRSGKGATGLTREERGRRAVLAPERHLAVFDLENTLIASNVVDSYSWLATRHLDDADRVRFVARTLREAPRLLALDRADRGDFLRYFYRRYEGAPIDRLSADGWELFSDMVLTKSFPAGIRRVREHRALGHKTLLITGALDVVIDPLRPLFDDVVCAKLGQKNGRFNGELIEAPPTGEARAILMADYAKANGLELEQSVAYADSASDLPMLEVVGHPVAVNPETKLAAIARKRGWHVEHWPKSPGATRPPLPIGPRLATAKGWVAGSTPR